MTGKAAQDEASAVSFTKPTPGAVIPLLIERTRLVAENVFGRSSRVSQKELWFLSAGLGVVGPGDLRVPWLCIL